MTSSNTLSRSAWRITGAALILALAGTAAQMAQAQPGGGMGPMGGPMGAHMAGPMGGGHFGGGMHLRLLQQVGASAEQQAKIQDIMKAARDDVRAQRQAAGDLRAQMAQVMAAPTVDARAAETLRQKMSAVHEATSKRMLQAMLDASAVLTPEQRQKLAEQMAQRRDMMQRHQRERATLDGAPRR
ncbi:MAG: periplasmic heavy metal sensor [Burkholderiales bacterium]|nr:periplasmic heavy metal sensor [Burkholderiales bacterium]